MKQLTCTICKSVSYPFFEYKDLFGEPVCLFKCINCGHGMHDRQYIAAHFCEIYNVDYSTDYLVKGNANYQQRQVQYALDVELLLGCRKFGSVRVLDYGCSSGGYLDAMPSEWDKSGFEVNPYYTKYIREKKTHITVFDNVSLIDRQFDLITMRGVIEHIPDHTELITFLGRHLAPGGAAFITATPDFSSVCATLYKSKWSPVVCPEHIHQFSSTSLSILLARAGLVLRSLNHPYVETPYADWEKDKLCFSDNFLMLQHDSNADIAPIHAFAGNMISAFYEK